MLSKKCQKYINQYSERNYAIKSRKIEKNDLQKHCDGGSIRKASEAIRSDSLQQSRQIKEELKEYSCCNGHQFNAEDSTESSGEVSDKIGSNSRNKSSRSKKNGSTRSKKKEV